MCSGRVSSSCSNSGTRRVNLVTNPMISLAWGKDRQNVIKCSVISTTYVSPVVFWNISFFYYVWVTRSVMQWNIRTETCPYKTIYCWVCKIINIYYISGENRASKCGVNHKLTLKKEKIQDVHSTYQQCPSCNNIKISERSTLYTTFPNTNIKDRLRN